MLSIKDLVFKNKLVKKLMEQYMGSYVIKEVVLMNAVNIIATTSHKNQ